ncbi:PAS domain-containing protein [Mycobacterium sp. 852002-40037_SCH5390672]|uniref:PAS domain-containing protein n=1 Tax=Mycobacterium sp. 852002-40037_SCH5390672 TaxID=1834089 RepID=UPI000805313B|nr:PAS domain-containing protein [Mycobacterium sp. 852002-40037_SCH5390672]OBB95802.1 hypothetical protein A5782_05875 [Mycobacterium sp. 852002-40037_SCH5390672]
MGHDWLLFETLGTEPVVVAQGDRLRKYVPLTSFFRRNSNISEIRSIVSATVAQRQPLVKDTTGRRISIRTEPIIMTDGHVHGVHLWIGPPNIRPRARFLPGAVKWDLTAGTATDTPQALKNSGLNVELEQSEGRPFAADLPIGGAHNHDESKVIAAAINCKPGDTFCSTWNVTTFDGNPIRVSFVARANFELNEDGTEHLVARAMNWRAPREETRTSDFNLASQILEGMAQEGLHRALVDLETWNLLKWVDPPCPHIDWRSKHPDLPLVHPDDRPTMRFMAKQFTRQPAVGLLRLRSTDGRWTRMHVTIYQVALPDATPVGLICIRLPTPADLAAQRFS